MLYIIFLKCIRKNENTQKMVCFTLNLLFSNCLFTCFSDDVRLFSDFNFGIFCFFLDFLLHPFRKPKRVRTAFSPSQLLKLEHAFESNQYVVGAERKALAQALNLSETQVCDILL